ncbi:fungal specific transcription factor domain-containing protein [Paraphaeosphaeria sporulosa]
MLRTTASLPAGEGPARFSPAAVQDWAPRRKSVSNACERCRRRKIRCDGDTPCATCKRFSLTCLRTQKPREVVASEHQAALESRIHHLEAQLAAHVNAPMHGMESIDENLMASTPTSFDWGQSSTSLSLDTSFASAFTSEPSQMNLGSFSAGGVGPRVPAIAITECELVPKAAVVSSPVPSFWSGTTRASSPDAQPTSAPSYPPMGFPVSTKSYTPSPGPPHATEWDFMAQRNKLKPEAPQSGSISRATSTSSHSMESEEAGTEDETDVLPLAPAPRLPRPGLFAAHTESPPPGSSRSSFTDRSRALTTTPFPSRFEAETLTSEFIQHLESAEQRGYSVTPGLFSRFCESVYPDPKKRGIALEIPVSTQMARFHVFMAMAIGMKMRIKDSPENTNSLLDTCYDLAMQQASSPPFWQENGGVEATQLLNIFASIRKEPTFAPKPLQPSMSW